MFKKYLLIALSFFIIVGSFGITNIEITNAESAIKTALIDNSESDAVFMVDDNGFSILSQIFVWVKDSLTGVLVLLAVGAFLFIGVRLALARGNPEEFKKGMMQLVYAIVGIFLISIAWAAVYLVSGLQI